MVERLKEHGCTIQTAQMRTTIWIPSVGTEYNLARHPNCDFALLYALAQIQKEKKG